MAVFLLHLCAKALHTPGRRALASATSCAAAIAARQGPGTSLPGWQTPRRQTPGWQTPCSARRRSPGLSGRAEPQPASAVCVIALWLVLCAAPQGALRRAGGLAGLWYCHDALRTWWRAHGRKAALPCEGVWPGLKRAGNSTSCA